jgi:hypothetical protein
MTFSTGLYKQSPSKVKPISMTEIKSEIKEEIAKVVEARFRELSLSKQRN